MKRIIVTIIFIILNCFFVIGYFFITDWRYRIDYSLRGDLILQMPLGRFAIPLVSPGEISFDDILTTGVKLISKDNKLFLLRDQSFPSRWYFDYRQPWTITNEEFDKHIELWEFYLLEGGNIHIEGYFWFEFYVRKITLTGTKQKDGIWSGEGLVSEGVMGLKPDESGEYQLGGLILEERKELYKINWRMFPKDQKDKFENEDELKKGWITRHIPVEILPQESEEEIEARSKLQSRVFASMPPMTHGELVRAKVSPYPENQKLEKSFGSSERRKKILYARDKILTDIDWSEIDDNARLPEMLFAIDHLVTIEEAEVSGYIILGQYRNESVIAIKYDWKSWAKIPLLFLLVYYNDWLTAERVEGLSKLSNRLRFIIAEVKKHGNDSPNKLEEIMISVLSKLSDQERRDYFVKSIKLRNYVKESNNLSLQKLMPNDLPPPPGPPENMRDWYNSEGKLRRGAFVRLEDDPDRGKVLILLDEDRIELICGFDDMSKETQRYITEMLEAQAEDAAEAEKNKKQ